MFGHSMTQAEFDRQGTFRLWDLEDKLLRQLSFMTDGPDEWERLIRLVYCRYRHLVEGFWRETRIAWAPERVALRLVGMGCWMEEEKRWSYAQTYYRRALGREPLNRVTSFLTNNNLGRCFLETLEFDKSESHCRAAIRIGPHLPEPYWYLAQALYPQMRFYETAEALISAASNKPCHPGALRSLERLIVEHPDLRGELGEKLYAFRDKFQAFYPLEVERFREFKKPARLSRWTANLIGRR